MQQFENTQKAIRWANQNASGNFSLIVRGYHCWCRVNFVRPDLTWVEWTR